MINKIITINHYSINYDIERYYLTINKDKHWLYKIDCTATTLMHLGTVAGAYIAEKLYIKVPMNINNPQETIDRFYKLLVLK